MNCLYDNSQFQFIIFPSFRQLETSIMHVNYRFPNCQNATALAAATFSESTPCAIGMHTV